MRMLAHGSCRYNATISGPSGNITVNGTLTYGAGSANIPPTLQKRGTGAASESDVDLSDPPYAIHNGEKLRRLAFAKLLN